MMPDKLNLKTVQGSLGALAFALADLGVQYAVLVASTPLAIRGFVPEGRGVVWSGVVGAVLAWHLAGQAAWGKLWGLSWALIALFRAAWRTDLLPLNQGPIPLAAGALEVAGLSLLAILILRLLVRDPRGMAKPAKEENPTG